MGTNLKESFKNEKIERLRDHITGYLDYKNEEVVNYNEKPNLRLNLR